MSKQFKPQAIRTQSTRFIIILFTLFFLSCQASKVQEDHPYGFLNQTYKPYCFNNVLTEQQFELDMILREQRRIELSSWVPLIAERWIQDLVLLCNNKPAEMLKVLNNFFKYALIYSTPFLIGLAILLILGGVWFYFIFWNTQNKSSGLAVEPYVAYCSKISWWILIVSMVCTAFVSFYGISQTPLIERSMNRFWCLLVKQEYGYIRGPNGLEGNLLDAASEIGNFRAFLNGRYAAVSGVIGKLQKDGIMTDSYQLGSSLKSGLIQVATQKDGFSDILSLSEDISRTLIKTIQGEQSSLSYYNSTMEYVRQIAIGLTFLKGNIDRYGARFIGFDNISKIFSGGTKFLLTLAIVVAVSSLIGMSHIVIKQNSTKLYYKYISQYAFGIICALCLISAVFNSFLTIFLKNVSDVATYLLVPGNPRSIFLSSGSLNDPLVEIIASVWPQASGYVTEYGNSTLLLDLAQIEDQISQLNKLSLWEQYDAKEASLSEGGISGLLEYKQSLVLIQKEMSAIRNQMLSPQGLAKLNPTGFGRNLFDAAQAAVFNIFNRSYQYRHIFAYISLFLFAGIFSTFFIKVTDNSYVRTNEIDVEGQFDGTGELRAVNGQHSEEGTMLAMNDN